MMSILRSLKRKKVNKMKFTANDIQDALENSWSDFRNNLQDRNLDGRTEVIVESIVAKVLDNIEHELGE